MTTSLTPAEARVLRWLEVADFKKTGCRHSQKTIAFGAQCTERTVIRATKRLQNLGLITIGKERRPGCKWLCNVYRVRDWNPHLRSGVLNVLAARREAQCQTERKATASRAQTTPQDPSSPRSVCGCARGTHPISARRSRMCDCKQCAEQNARLTDELSGAMHTVRKLGAENLKLRGAAAHGAPDDPKTTKVWFLLENWLWLCRGRKRSDGLGRLPVIDPGSKRWRIAQAAERREPEGLVACIEAVEGLACKPFVSDHGRTASGRPSQRYDDIEYALKDETTVERCRRYRAEVLGANEPALFHAWQQCAASDHLYFTLWTGRRARAAFEGLPDYKQVAHRMRVAEAADDAELARVIDLHSRRDVA